MNIYVSYLIVNIFRCYKVNANRMQNIKLA